MNLGKVVKKYRKQQDISQRELAERTDLSEVYIGYLEQNRRVNPTLETLGRVAVALNTTVTVIMQEAEQL